MFALFDLVARRRQRCPNSGRIANGSLFCFNILYVMRL